jgi:tRNA modification GTPase
MILEAPEGVTSEDERILGEMNGRPALVVWNKCDLSSAVSDGLLVSARTGAGVEDLRSELARCLQESAENGLEEILCGERHEEEVRRALCMIRQACDTWANGGTEELVASEVRSAAAALGEITGKSVGEDVLDRIFSQFCIGK